MTRIAIAIALAASSLFAAPANAADARAVDGQAIDLDSPSVLVFWSLDDGAIGLHHAAALAQSGARVVAVNTDAAADTSRVRALAVRNAPRVPVVMDTSGQLQRSVRASEPEAVIIDADGQVVWRTHDLDDTTHRALAVAALEGATDVAVAQR